MKDYSKMKDRLLYIPENNLTEPGFSVFCSQVPENNLIELGFSIFCI